MRLVRDLQDGRQASVGQAHGAVAQQIDIAAHSDHGADGDRRGHDLAEPPRRRPRYAGLAQAPQDEQERQQRQEVLPLRRGRRERGGQAGEGQDLDQPPLRRGLHARPEAQDAQRNHRRQHLQRRPNGQSEQAVWDLGEGRKPVGLADGRVPDPRRGGVIAEGVEDIGLRE